MDGVFERRPYAARPDRFDYRLTAKGRGLYPASLLLLAWGDRWLFPDGAPVILVHAPCGQATTAVARCGGCGGAVDASSVRYEADAANPPGANPPGAPRCPELQAVG